MISLTEGPVWLYDNRICFQADGELTPERLEHHTKEKITETKLPDRQEGRRNTITAGILEEHDEAKDGEELKLKFDSLISHDLTYVGAIQTAKASGLEKFPIPYVLTNCHNSLCAVGGTINCDDHVFGMSAAEKYGGIFVPANQAVIHQYAREVMSGCGRMILGTDSHTRYGALGTLGVGEGGGELVKQLLGRTYELKRPQVIAVYLTGQPKHGIGPQDIALALVGAVFQSGFAKNKVLEFVGPGVGGLSMDFRNGIDVMTTETACLSSVWCTDEKVREYFKIHGREQEYRRLEPKKLACYDGLISIDLSRAESMIALPFHPSNAYSIKELNENLMEILGEIEEKDQKLISNPKLRLDLKSKVHNGKLRADQAEIAGCAGGSFENLTQTARILAKGRLEREYYALSLYPASIPIYLELVRNGTAQELLQEGTVLKTAFCGPCFGAGDVPSNGALDLRHTTRNFPNREGSKPSEGQLASVALMDARSIAATSIRGGEITPATEMDYPDDTPEYRFDGSSYEKTVYNGFGKPKPEESLRLGPNITDWPEMVPLQENILLRVASVIGDPVTTTDELIPSGDAASYRSNPERMAQFTLSRRDPEYVGAAREFQELEKERREKVRAHAAAEGRLKDLTDLILSKAGGFNSPEEFLKSTGFGSAVYAVKPGDGSAREQAASCQRVLGGLANLTVEYATKRYRSNLINWGILPFTAPADLGGKLHRGDFIFVPHIYEKLKQGDREFPAVLIGKEKTETLTLSVGELSDEEAQILLSGSLINYYAGMSKS
jgi:aconitate hydratase